MQAASRTSTPAGADHLRHGDSTEVSDTTLRSVSALIAAGKESILRAELRSWPLVKTINLFSALSREEACTLLRWSERGMLRVIADLNPAFLERLLQQDSLDQFERVMNSMSADESWSILQGMPEELAQRLLPLLHDRDLLLKRSGVEDDSAASIMSEKFVAVPPGWNVEQIIDEMRLNARHIESLYAVNVVDPARRPIGYIRLRDLLLAPRDTTAATLMETDFVAVKPGIDQEEVARLAERLDMSVVPVVDEQDRLIGRITPDRLRQIIREEAEEDLNRMSGLPADANPDESLARIVRGRSPWLLLGLAGAGLAALVVSSFEEQLAEAAILASFIPVVMSIAGNAGIQASTVAVQGLTSGEIAATPLVTRLLRELGGALVNGAIAGLGVVLLALLMSFFVPIEEPLRLAGVAICSVVIIVLLAVLIGATVPIALDRLGIDPALAMGVFITTSNDVLAVIVFFLLASSWYL